MNEKFDEVKKAKHYNMHPSGVECIDIVKHHSFNIGNVIKYVWRAGLKEPSKEETLKDLKKARYYLDKEIEMMGGTPATIDETLLAEANRLALEAIARVRSIHGANETMGDALGVKAKKDDIAQAIANLLMQGIDVSDPPQVVFVEGVDVVHSNGKKGKVVAVDWSSSLSWRGPICVEWPEGCEAFDKPMIRRWHLPEDLAIDSSPVPVTLEDAPSRAVPAYMAEEKS